MNIVMSLARKNPEPEPSNITYFYDNCDLINVGLNELSLNAGAFGLGLVMQRIVDNKRMSLIKIIDPIVTHRLQRAFFSGKKFRKMSLTIQENITAHQVRFEDIVVIGLKQRLESGIIKDIVTIEAGYAQLN